MKREYIPIMLDGSFIQQFTRELFWQTTGNIEPQKEKAKKLLGGLHDSNGHPLTEEQISAVLHGDAYLEGIAASDGSSHIRYVKKTDTRFKQELKEVRENLVEITGRRIGKDIIEAYVKAGSKSHRKLFWNNILREAGFTDEKRKRIVTYRILTIRKGKPVKDFSDYQNFKEELNDYIKSTYN